MKPINGIWGCALAAGLMTFAAGKTQAAVINNTLFSPAKIMVTATYESNGKIKKMSITSKEVLKDVGGDKGDTLAVDNDFGDAWIIHKDSIVTDLTDDGNLFIEPDNFVSVTSGKNNNKYAESGLMSVDFYDDPQFDINDDFDTSASEDASDNWFEISGVYSFKDSYGPDNKKGFYQENESYSAPALSGAGFFLDLEQGDTVPVAGSESSNGSGKILD